MVDIARPESVKRKKKIRRAVYAGAGLLVIVLITVGVSRLKPAAPGVERATVWIDTVKRSDMIRQVRGSGTLVPENIRWIPATTQGRVERIVLRPGARVEPGTVILEMSNPDLQQSVMDAQLAYQSAQAAFVNRKAELESQLLNQESQVATIESNYKQAQLRLEANQALFKDGLISELQLKEYQGNADELKNRLSVEKKRLDISRDGIKSQLAPQEAEVNQRKASLDLRLRQLEDLKVKSMMTGVLQVVPVEVGQQVAPGANLARVADPTVLKAELRIAETQTKDIEIGQSAEVDTRNGIVPGRVSRIDPASANGTVGVDIQLEGQLPPGARPDLSVDGTVRLEKLDNVINVGRPAFGQEDSTITLFKLMPNGEAIRTQVRLGRSSVNTIEIKEGLQPGDQVILSDMSTYDQFDRVRITG
ncbi:MAG TPA: HlyD family efflux transporter periplasmic adaptor subunit [Vicinamibacterales bacterium]|nr:HlyD family efflux transporter periplasmic adaptor subunit [Vicinamibacterales bacterium]